MEKFDHLKIQQTLNRLRTYKSSNSPILSLYLGSNDKKSPNKDLLLSEFHSLINKNLKEEERKLFQKDILKINNYLKDTFDTRGNRSVVFFTSGKHLFETLDFEFYLPTLFKISNLPYIKPITKSLKDHKKYLVLLVDREKARIFTVHLGEIEKHLDIFDPSVPQKVKQINKAFGREDKILRHIEDHLHRHLKLIVDKTKEFVTNEYINFIIIGGHKGLFAKVKKLLPKNLADKVKGTFVTELNIPINDAFLKSKKIANNINNEK